MKLHELSPAPGSTKEVKRIGRGHGSGNGKTAGKGHKGQNARSGGGVRIGFEGGQMPLTRRIPKRGFNNIFAKEYAIVNVSDLNKFTEGTVVDAELLKAAGLIKKTCDGVKVLGDGELTTKLTVKAAKFTKSAVEKIEKAGGKAEVMYRVQDVERCLEYCGDPQKAPVHITDAPDLPSWQCRSCSVSGYLYGKHLDGF